MSTTPALMRGDLTVDGLDLTLVPNDGPVPVAPILNAVRVTVSPNGFRVVVGAAVAEANGRAPVNLALKRADLIDGGLQVVARASKGPFGSDVGAQVLLSVVDGRLLRADLVEVDAPKWVPVDTMIEVALKQAGGLVEPIPGEPRSFLVDPVRLLASTGVPGDLAPGGVWSVDATPQGLTLAFG